jgi:hypothetical protein
MQNVLVQVNQREHVVIDVEENEFLDILLLQQFMQEAKIQHFGKRIKFALKLKAFKDRKI